MCITKESIMQKIIQHSYSILLLLLATLSIHAGPSNKNKKSVTFSAILSTEKNDTRTFDELNSIHWQTEEEYNQACTQAQKETSYSDFGNDPEKIKRRKNHQELIKQTLPYFNKRKNESTCTIIIPAMICTSLICFYLCYKPEIHKK